MLWTAASHIVFGFTIFLCLYTTVYSATDPTELCRPVDPYTRYSVDCLTYHWHEAGCFSSGTSSPRNKDTRQLSWWRERSLREVKADMNLYFEYAEGGDSGYRMKCFGNLEKCSYTEFPGHALYGRNDKTLFNVDQSQCKAECNKMKEKCQSFDYKTKSKICFMSAFNRDSASNAFGAHDLFVHFEKDCDSHETLDIVDTEGKLHGSIVTIDGHCYVVYGPVAGTGGRAFSDRTISLNGNITQVRVRHASLVDALQFRYGDITTDRHGGNGGRLDSFALDKDEYITVISGRAGKYLESITFISSKLRTFGPYGSNQNDKSFMTTADGKQLAFISGRYGGLVDQLSFYFYC